MSIHTPLPDMSVLMDLRRRGKTLKEIADSFGVETAQVWHALLRGSEAESTP
ncbi:hypothetical protein LG284_11260 [Citricoccus nitrophenolicus]